MVWDSVQLETAVNTISHEYLLDFISEYGIPEMLHPELPGPGDRIVDFPEGWMSFSKRPGKNTPQCYTKPLDSFKNWNNRFFWVDERVFPTVVDWQTNAPKDGMPAAGTYSVEAVRALDTHRTPIQKQPEMLLCLLDSCPKSYKGKGWGRPRAPHEVPLLMLTVNRVIEMDDPATATDSSGVPPTIERSPLDFSLEAGASNHGTAASEVPPSEVMPAAAAPEPSKVGVAAADPPAATESRKRGRDRTDANAPPSLASTASMPEDAPTGVSDLDPLFFADPPARPSADVFPSLLDTPEACQDLVDHFAPPGYFSELRHMRNEDFLGQYNVNLARQVAMGSQLRLRFEQEAKLLKKSVAQVARRDKRIQARELKIKNLEALLETEADMKKAAEDKSAGLIKELEDMRARHEHLSQQVASLKEQVSGEEKLKAAFEEFKRYEDDRVERRCAELDARLDALSIDFDEELYPHMLTAIAGRRWVIGYGLRLAAMKCDESLDMRQAFDDVVSAGITKGMSEGLRHGVEHGQAQRNVESIEAYDPEAEAKFVAALQALKDLKYPLLDQLEGLKDAPIDVIMAALYLKSDTGEDSPQCIRDLRPSSSQLTIPVYPEVRDPQNHWACKEEIVLADAIAANISRAEKKKKCRIICRTHGVGSAHHARSDGILVSAPTVVPQGLALLLADAATQTE
nr:hypothetical protein [Tanacetum cinerariifolium]